MRLAICAAGPFNDSMKIFLSLLWVVVLFPLGAGAKDFSVSGGTGEVGKSKTAYAAAEAGKAYPLNWWARTQSGALRILFSPGNEFRLLPRSEVQVTGAGDAGGRFRRVLKLNDGSVELDLQKLEGSKVEVETPTAICGAVGTHFLVNAVTGAFNVTQGRISASAKGDGTFAAQSVSGAFTLQPGRENAFVEASVTGNFQINGRAYAGTGVRVEVAKARGGPGMAAVRVVSGTLGGTGPGSFIMEGAALSPVEPERAALHGRYLAAAGREGMLHVQRQGLAASGRPVPAALDASLAEAAREATALRQQLFARRVIRDAAQEAARDATRSNARPGVP
jgi:hypothetical protein